METGELESTLVFSRTKHAADRIVKILGKARIEAAAIHGNKTQGARERALKSFKSGEISVLIATDIAARGIDISGLSHVINYDLPNVPETYVHRIGRTGRAEASGATLSFCDIEERPYLKDIEKFIKQTIPLVEDHPFPDTSTPVKKITAKKPQAKQQKRGYGQSKPQNGSRRKPRY